MNNELDQLANRIQEELNDLSRVVAQVKEDWQRTLIDFHAGVDYIAGFTWRT